MQSKGRVCHAVHDRHALRYERREALFNARDFEARSFNGCPEHVVGYEKIGVDSGFLLFKAHFNGINAGSALRAFSTD